MASQEFTTVDCTGTYE